MAAVWRASCSRARRTPASARSACHWRWSDRGSIGFPSSVAKTRPEAVNYSGLADGSHTLGVTARDRAGNEHTVARSWRVDTAAPTAAATVPRHVLDGPVVVTLKSQDKVAGVASHDVRYRKATPSQRFGAFIYPTTWQRTTASARKLNSSPGVLYCFSFRARDKAGHLSGWSTERCGGAPGDDRALTRSGPWTSTTHAGAYRGTYSKSQTTGATLTLPRVTASRLALIAKRGPGYGKVTVSIGSRHVAVVNLSATTTSHRKLIQLPTFRLTTGSLVIRSLNGRPVWLDGVAAHRS